MERPPLLGGNGEPYRCGVTGEPEAAVVRIASTSHRLRVVAGDQADVAVEGEADVVSDGARTTIDGVRSRLVVHVPAGADVIAGSTSGRIVIEGPVGEVAVTTESGGVRVRHAESVDVRSESSRVEIADVRSDCRIRTRSGSVQVEHCGGGADLAAKTGRIELTSGSGPVRAQCSSGRIDITLLTAQDVEAETISGRINVALPAGTRPYRSDGWEAPAATPDGYDCTVTARSATGKVTVAAT